MVTKKHKSSNDSDKSPIKGRVLIQARYLLEKRKKSPEKKSKIIVEQSNLVSSPIHIMNPKKEDNKYFFRDTYSYQKAALSYLQWKYPKNCIIFNKTVYSPMDKIIIYNKANFSLEENYINCILWNNINKDWICINNFYSQLVECISKNPRFIIMPMIALGMHSNKIPISRESIFIYDMKSRQLEHFDPTGDYTRVFYSTHFKEYIYRLFSDIENFLYPDDIYLSDTKSKGIQKLQEDQCKKDFNYIALFSHTWPIWYADTRMANPRKTRYDVIDLSIIDIRNKPGSFTGFIKSYSAFIEKIYEEMNNYISLISTVSRFFSKNKDIDTEYDKIFKKIVQTYS